MNHYKYTKKEPNLHVCNICHHEFNQINDEQCKQLAINQRNDWKEQFGYIGD